MSKTFLRIALLGTLAAAIFGLTLRSTAAPDEGKALVYLPKPAKPAIPGPCDRACLKGFVDKYFDALVEHCACGVAFAPEVKYTENGQDVALGEGMWKTFTGRGKYRVYLADPSTGEAGYYGDVNEFENSLLGVMALRLKVKDHRITEVETVVVREQLRPRGGLGKNTAGIMTPRMIDELQPNGFTTPDRALLAPVAPSARASAAQLTAVANRYYEGFNAAKGSEVPFAERCSRRENGIAATNNADGPVVDSSQPSFHVFSQSCAQEVDRGFFSGLSSYGDHRALVVDAEQGLVLNLAFLDNEGNVKSVSVHGVGDVKAPTEFMRPITYMEPQLFKIEGGKITRIEGLSWAMPYGSRSGWGQ